MQKSGGRCCPSRMLGPVSSPVQLPPWVQCVSGAPTFVSLFPLSDLLALALHSLGSDSGHLAPAWIRFPSGIWLSSHRSWIQPSASGAKNSCLHWGSAAQESLTSIQEAFWVNLGQRPNTVPRKSPGAQPNALGLEPPEGEESCQQHPRKLGAGLFLVVWKVRGTGGPLLPHVTTRTPGRKTLLQPWPNPAPGARPHALISQGWEAVASPPGAWAAPTEPEGPSQPQLIAPQEPTACPAKGSGRCCLEQEEEEEPGSPHLREKRMAEDPSKRRLTFQGARTTWLAAVTLQDLLQLRADFPHAPLVMGNTTVGPDIKFKGEFYPVFISAAGLPELRLVNSEDGGVIVGAGHSLAQLSDALRSIVSEQPPEKTQTCRALLTALRTLAGAQIRSMATLGGHVATRATISDLNPILAAGKATIHLISKEGERQIPLDSAFLEGSPEASLQPGEVVLSVSIPYSTQWQFVSGLRQAQRHENSMAIVNAGMSVQFEDGTSTIQDLQLFYGGVGPTVVSASRTCRQLVGRQWDDQTLGEACQGILGEVHLPPNAPGGQVQFRRTLLLSLLFKFYLSVRRGLSRLDPQKFPDIPEQFMSALEDFPIVTPQGIQMFQCVDPRQPLRDPVGHPVMHQSALKHATGEAVFVDDMPPLDRELSLAVVTSTRAHAKVTSIDTAEALALPGVVAVITAEDVPGKNNHQGEIFYAQSEVICVGQIVCTVAADTYAHAREAAKRVQIEYEDIEPRIVTVEQALEHNSFLSPERKIEQGNVEWAFKHVDQIIEAEEPVWCHPQQERTSAQHTALPSAACTLKVQWTLKSRPA